jgi:hypothetical protein
MEVARVKYNNYRRSHFQTATVILEGEGKRHVVKRGLTADCGPHIESLQGKYYLLDRSYMKFHVIPPMIVGSEAHFEFDKGVSLLAKLCNIIRMGELAEFELELMKFAGAVGSAAKSDGQWWRHQGFVKIFGQVPAQFQRPMLCLSPANIDLVFSNVHVRSDDEVPYAMFDYEWTFDFAVPLEYVIWRALNRFEKTLSATTHQKWTIERLCRTVGVDIASTPLFESMEQRFQHYVYGEAGFQNAPANVNTKLPIVDYEQLARWVVSAGDRPLRGARLSRRERVKRALGPLIVPLRWAKRALSR